MTLPGTPSLVFLFYLLLFLPWAAFRSARRLRSTGKADWPSRERIWAGTLVSQIVLLLLAWLVGRSFNFNPFEIYSTKPRQLMAEVAAVLALACCFGLRWLSVAIRSRGERRKMMVYVWAPQSSREWVLWVCAVLVASVAEEIAYRGVGLSILWYSLGNGWVAVLISAAAFSLAHSTQGLKSAGIVFGVAMVIHGLVAFTGTLVYAVIVHAVYDLVVGYAISRKAKLYLEEETAAV